jgi:hypothetical protein
LDRPGAGGAAFLYFGVIFGCLGYLKPYVEPALDRANDVWGTDFNIVWVMELVVLPALMAVALWCDRFVRYLLYALLAWLGWSIWHGCCWTPNFTMGLTDFLLGSLAAAVSFAQDTIHRWPAPATEWWLYVQSRLKPEPHPVSPAFKIVSTIVGVSMLALLIASWWRSRQMQREYAEAWERAPPWLDGEKKDKPIIDPEDETPYYPSSASPKARRRWWRFGR